MSEIVQCQFNEEGAQIPTSLNAPLTVGKEVLLTCTGEFPKFNVERLKAEALNQPEHTLKLLKYEPQGENTVLTLTSYRVGEFQDVQVLLADGTLVARTNPLSFKVESVVDPQNPEAGKPFGPFGPWTISWPWWYFLILILIIAITALAGLKVWKASKRKLEIRKKINEYRQKFNPFDQFQKTLRRLDREYQANLVKNVPSEKLFDELQAASLTYLMMEFEMDVERKTPRWILKRLKKKAPKAKASALNDLGLYLNEFLKNKNSADVDRMIDWAGRISEKVDRESFGIKT
jgi:hypothetical protein